MEKSRELEKHSLSSSEPTFECDASAKTLAAPHRQLRMIGALVLHEIRSLAVNPSMIATIVVLIIFTVLFTEFFHFFEWFSAPFLCQLAVCSIGGIGTVCILAEERERGVEQTLLLSGMTRASITTGKVIGCILVCEFICIICAFVIMRTVEQTAQVAFLMLFTIIPISFVSVAIGMRLNDQQRASSWGSPLLFCGVITASMNTVAGISPWMLPTGAAPELIDVFLFGNTTPVVSPTITIVVGIAYCLLALGILIKSARS